MAIALQSSSTYLYSGLQMDLVCTLAQEHEGVVVTRFRKGVAVCRPSVKLSVAEKKLLNGMLSQKDWQRLQTRQLPLDFPLGSLG